jgi:hypothetical protein
VWALLLAHEAVVPCAGRDVGGAGAEVAKNKAEMLVWQDAMARGAQRDFAHAAGAWADTMAVDGVLQHWQSTIIVSTINKTKVRCLFAATPIARQAQRHAPRGLPGCRSSPRCDRSVGNDPVVSTQLGTSQKTRQRYVQRGDWLTQSFEWPYVEYPPPTRAVVQAGHGGRGSC